MNPTPAQLPVALTQRNPPLPDWLINDANLADEAVLVGLSEARPDERIAQIRLAFAEQTIGLEKHIEQAQEQVGELNLTIETAQARLDLLESAPQPTGNRRFSSMAVQRFLLTLSLTLAGSVMTRFVADALFPATTTGLLVGSIIGLGGVGVSLIRYRFEHENILEQQRANRLCHHEQTTRLTSELIDCQATKQNLIGNLYQAEAERDQLYAHRDRLIRLFESEFDLARSLRYSLQPTETPYV